jgi:hypothetical protein
VWAFCNFSTIFLSLTIAWLISSFCCANTGIEVDYVYALKEQKKMRFGKIGMAAAAAASLVSAPVLAQAVQPVSSVARTSATVDSENNVEGGSGIILAILAAAAVIGGIIIAADGSDDTPTSP